MIRIKNPNYISRLPDEYQEVEYLQSTGTQYIDTNVKMNATTVVKMTFSATSQVDDAAIIGCWDSNLNGFVFLHKGYGDGFQFAYANGGYNGNIVPYDTNSHIVEITGTEGKLDGVTLATAGSKNIISTSSIYICGIGTYNKLQKISAKIFSCQINDNGETVRDFVPCYRKSDNIPGLYDSVNNVFYTNAGTGTFLVGKDINIKDINIIPTTPVRKYFTEITYVPDEYQRVEYIESSATQYIDTGFIPTENTRIEAEIAITDTRTSTSVWPAFWGAQSLANGSDNKSFTFGYTPSAKTMPGSYVYTIGTKYKIKMSSLDGYVINDTKRADYNWVGSPGVSLGLFTRKSGNNGFETCMQATARVYNLSIYENNILIYNYIPCYRKSDNVIGLYDNINNVFRTNQGTGTFTKGINLDNKEIIEVKSKIPQEYQELDYIQSSGTQWIDTGVSGDGLGTFEIKFNTLGTMERPFEMYFAGRATTTTVKIYENASDHNIVAQQDPNVWVLFPAADTIDHTIIVGSNGIYRDGTKIVDYTPGAWGPKSYIIANSQDENIPASMKIYYLKMYTDGVLVRDYIPCYRKSDNVTGLYDLVNNQFYVSIGSENFIKGNEVAYLKMVNIPLKAKLLGNKVIYEKWPTTPYEQLINYTMLYDNGDECTSVTGGWNLHTNNYGTLTKNSNNIYFNSTGNGICIKTKNQINVSGYNGWLVVSKNYTYGESAGQNAIWCTTSTNTYGYPDNDTMVVPATISSYNNMTDEGNRKPVFWYSFYKTSTGSGYIKKCWRNNHHTGNLAAIAMTKPDNWQELANILNINATSINDIITASDKLLNNKDSVLYMLYNCTGDFMAAAVQSETFLTALNNSLYKTKIYANEHWNKFLTMIS